VKPALPLEKERVRRRKRLKPSSATQRLEDTQYVLSLNTAKPCRSLLGIPYSVLNQVGERRTSKTILHALKVQEPFKAFQTGVKPIWRSENKNLRHLRNGRGSKMSTRDINVSHAWLTGLLCIQPIKGTSLPEKFLKYFNKPHTSNLYMKKKDIPEKVSLELMSFLFHNCPNILNIFGSIVESCRLKDPVLRAIIASNSYIKSARTRALE